MAISNQWFRIRWYLLLSGLRAFPHFEFRLLVLTFFNICVFVFFKLIILVQLAILERENKVVQGIVWLDSHFRGVRIDFDLSKINFINFLWYSIFRNQNQFLPLELILGEVKFFYFLSKIFLEKLSNINHFISKSILTKSTLSRIFSRSQTLSVICKA